MNMNPLCKARQFSDSVSCELCDLIWDMHDPEPPTCRYEDEDHIKEIQSDFHMEPEDDLEEMMIESHTEYEDNE